jgi:flagellar motor switch protein FliN/FliY
MSDDDQEKNVATEENQPEASTETPAEVVNNKEGGVDFPEHEGDVQSPEGSVFADNTLTDVEREKGLEVLFEVPVQVSAILGKTTMQVSQLLKLGRGAVVELDRKVGDAIDIYVNDRLVARGEVIIVDDHLGVTLTEIIKSEQAA